MLINKAKNFKLKIESLKYHRKDDGGIVFTEWTGYGKIIVSFGKPVLLNRGTRKPIFTMMYRKNRTLDIDVREYLSNHLDWLHYKENEKTKKEEEERNMITKFDDFEKKGGEQLSLF